MQFLKPLILGLVHGFGEFLPVSSSGNIYFFSNLMNTSADTLSFDILVHTASLIAIVLLFYKDWLHIIKNKFSPFNRNLLISCIPSIIITLIFQKKIETSMSAEHSVFALYLPERFCFMKQCTVRVKKALKE